MPPRDVFEGGPTREQQERLEAQTGGRRGSTQGRQQGDPRDMYGPRQEARPAQQGMSTGFDFGTGEKSGTLSQQEFMNVTGRTATNPYGKQGLFTRLFGIDPNNLDYSTNTPGGIATLNRVNALAYDQYLNPRDAQGNIRGMLREGSPTRSGTVVYDPTMETDLGIMGAIPYVGGFLRAANRRSALNISPYDNPLFSDMSDMGNELGAFPPPPDALEEIAPLESPAPAASSAAIQVSSPVSSLPDYEEMVGATPEESGTYILGGQIAPTSTYERVYTIEGTTPAEQAYLNEIRDDDLMYDYNLSYPAPPPRQLRNIDEPLILPGLF